MTVKGAGSLRLWQKKLFFGKRENEVVWENDRDSGGEIQLWGQTLVWHFVEGLGTV